MKITYKKGKGEKIHICTDGEYALTVDEKFFFGLGIRQNQDMSEEEFSLLQEKIGSRRAYNYCVSLLSRRDHSCHELRKKLLLKGFDESSYQAVDKLVEQGYVNDERFAVSYAGELIRLKHYGKRRVEQELMRKGVERDVIAAALEQVSFEDDSIIELIRRKYKRCFDDEKNKQRAVNGLLRLGYSYGEIRDAFSKVRDSDEFSFVEVEDE